MHRWYVQLYIFTFFFYDQVSETTALNVAVRFPSMESLQTYFSNSTREMYPAFDEKFVMGTALANKVLLRQVPSQAFAEKKHLHSFWLLNSTNFDVPLKSGTCLSQLKVNGMVTWGIRRQVKFLGRHEESNNTKSSSSFVQGDEIPKVEVPEKSEEDEEEEEEEEEEDEVGGESLKQEDDEETEENDEEEEAVTEKTNRNLKRKRYSLRATTAKQAKETRGEIQRQKNKAAKRNKCRQLTVYKDPKDRWSTER